MILRNIIYFSISIIVFLLFVLIYGITINSNSIPLNKILSGKKITQINSSAITIDRKKHRLYLMINGKQVKEYKAVFGRNKSIHKVSAEDYATPTGEYFICDIDSSENYYRFLHISYPSITDAAEALKNGIIDKKEFSMIKNTTELDDCPYPGTTLGSNIGIHGMGKYDAIFTNLPFVFDWTNGSAAISNNDIDELLTIVGIGTKVRIVN